MDIGVAGVGITIFFILFGCIGERIFDFGLGTQQHLGPARGGRGMRRQPARMAMSCRMVTSRFS
jgi:hypothetical protein